MFLVADLMRNVNSGLDDVMKIGKAVSEKDYIQAALFMIDMNLKSAKKQNVLETFTLEELRPTLRFIRQTLQVLYAKEGSEYYRLKFRSKVKIVFSSWKKSSWESWIIAKVYLQRAMKDARSGEFHKRMKARLNKVVKKIKFPIRPGF